MHTLKGFLFALNLPQKQGLHGAKEFRALVSYTKQKGKEEIRKGIGYIHWRDFLGGGREN